MLMQICFLLIVTSYNLGSSPVRMMRSNLEHMCEIMVGSVVWNVFPCVLICTTTGALEVFHSCSNGKIYAKKNMYTIPKNFG